VAVDCLEWLLGQPAFDLLGVVCATGPVAPWRKITGDRDMRAVAPALGVSLLDLDDLPRLRPDLVLSVRFHALLRRRHLESAALGVINLHGAPLPEMRGSMCDAMAIVEGRAEFGTSLHWMDEGIDTGDLLAVERFPIGPRDTVYDLFRQANHRGLELIQKHLLAAASGKLPGCSQETICRQEGIVPTTYRAGDVLPLKEVRPGLRPEQIFNRARAFHFPGHEPACWDTPAGRIHLTTSNPWGDL
jgi:methionyl-tRNA formyltransferase